MTIPLVWPRSGTDLKTLMTAIEWVSNELSAATWSSSHPANGYAGWAFDAVQHLQPHLTSHDLDRLIRTQTYWSILSRGAAGSSEVYAERQAREEDLRRVLESLKAFQRRFENMPGGAVIVVLDTSALMRYGADFPDANWRGLVGEYVVPHTVVHLVVPLIVIDELDNLKDRASSKEVKSKARGVLKVMHARTSNNPGWRSTLQGEALGSGAVTLEVLMESPERRRLPINDDEIVNVAARLANMFNHRRVVTVTCDTGFDLRAAAQDLRHIRMTAVD